MESNTGFWLFAGVYTGMLALQMLVLWLLVRRMPRKRSGKDQGNELNF